MEMKITSMAAALVAVVVLASTVLQSTDAANYTVGDTTGWTVPPGGGNSDFYDEWADKKNFFVGDILEFNFATDAHNVAEVTEAAYDRCNGTNPISMHRNGPASITLNRTGEYHFICTVLGHCTGGQKLSVNVRSGPRTTSTPGSTPNGGSSSSASSLVAAVSVAIVSLALVSLC
ncbi:putative Early nodulin 16 [Hibiscus syriacus]|uniref:Early nodulin 16 n=1 Tax=Hibiscus syriacus TaxID=106335 RepID=A0A6A3AB63_HIBSY|nr:stellacyanin-like [Hibiscus syriacus]KAE8700189.1 putative Early nodulin 16 [Hibiscus syriacus]